MVLFYYGSWKHTPGRREDRERERERERGYIFSLLLLRILLLLVRSFVAFCRFGMRKISLLGISLSFSKFFFSSSSSSSSLFFPSSLLLILLLLPQDHNCVEYFHENLLTVIYYKPCTFERKKTLFSERSLSQKKYKVRSLSLSVFILFLFLLLLSAQFFPIQC